MSDLLSEKFGRAVFAVHNPEALPMTPVASYRTDPAWLAFCRAIHGNPADDTPRLVLADWLDERSEAGRAEFIRVQCRIAHIQRGVLTPGGRYVDFDDGYDALRRREWELWDRHWQAWLPPAVVEPAYPVSGATAVRVRTDEEYDHDVQVTFGRGFPATVRGPLDALWRPCEACRGTRIAPTTDRGEGFPCPACAGRGQGAGALAALGPEVLCASSVEVSDKIPEQWTYRGVASYSWYDHGLTNDLATVPQPLFAEMVKQPYATLTDSGRVRFPTAFDAARALSAALLAAASGVAGGVR